MTPALRALALAVAGTALITLLMAANGLVPWQDPAFADYDHHAYMAIADQGPGAPGKASAPPFCWRILTPLMAAALPFGLPVSFFLINAAAVAMSALLMHALHRRSGLSPGWSLMGQVAFFSYFWAVGFNLWNYLMVDAVSLLVVVAGLWVLENTSWPAWRRTAALTAILGAGALNKESWVALGAAAAVLRWRDARHRDVMARAANALWPLLPAVLITVGLRLLIQADVSQMREFSSWSLGSVFREMVLKRIAETPRWAIEALVDPWGPLILVPVLSAPALALAWFRRHPHRAALLAVAFAQTLFGTSVGRLVMVGLPVLSLLSMERLRAHAEARAIGPGRLTGMMAAQYIFQYARRTTMGLGIPPYAPHPWVTAAYAVRAMALLAFAAAWSWPARTVTRGQEGRV